MARLALPVLVLALAAATATAGPIVEDTYAPPDEGEGPTTADTFVDETAPDATHGDATELEVLDRDGERARALVRVPAPAVPNATLLDAELRLTAREPGLAERELVLDRLAEPVREGEVNWTTRPSAAGTVGTATVDAASPAATWNVTAALDAAGYPSAPAPGFQVRGPDPGPQADRLDLASSATEDRPELSVTLDRNGPVAGPVDLAGAEDDARRVAAGDPIRATAAPEDPVGGIDEARLVLEREDGTLARNATLGPADGEGLAWTGSAPTPDGPAPANYTLSAAVRDTDGLWNRTPADARARLVVDPAGPEVNLSVAPSTVLQPQASTDAGPRVVDVAVRAGDAGRLSAVELRREAPDGDQRVLAERTLDGAGNASLAWNGTLDRIGSHRLVAEAVDDVGQRAVEEAAVVVRDGRAPRVALEAGPPVARERGEDWRPAAAVATAQPVDVRLAVRDGNGTVLERALAPAGGDRYTATVDTGNLDAGTYTFQVFAEPATGPAPAGPSPNASQLLVPAEAPVAEAVAAPARFSGPNVDLAVRVLDGNLRPDDVDGFATVDGRASTVDLRLSQVPGGLRANVSLDGAPDGARVAIGVTATDEAGNPLRRAWQTTVDAVGPTVRPAASSDRVDAADLGGRASGGARVVGVPANGTLPVDAGDPASGVTRLEATWRPAEGPPAPVQADPGGDLGPEGVADGVHSVRVVGVDAVGNRGPRLDAIVALDGQPPELEATVAGDLVRATARDGATGVADLRLEDGDRRLASLEGEGPVYEARVSGLEAAEDPQIVARDTVGNEATVALSEARQAAVVLDVETPLEGDRLAGQARSTWRVVGGQADAATTVLEHRGDPARAWQQLATDEGAEGRAAVPAGELLRGDHQLRWTAQADGARDRVVRNVTVVDGPPASAPIVDGEPVAGEPVTVAVDRFEAADEVRLVLEHAGQRAELELADGGQGPDARAGDARFTATWTPPSTGTWTASAKVQAGAGVEEGPGGKVRVGEAESVPGAGGLAALAAALAAAGMRVRRPP
jgi:hypothetical protein